MNKLGIFIGILLMFWLAACSAAGSDASTGSPALAGNLGDESAKEPDPAPGGSDMPDDTSVQTETEPSLLYIEANGNLFIAELADNSSAAALTELLADGPLTLELHDYGNFEKAGPLGVELPRNDEQITTRPGDVILYQGDQITIYYDVNSWSFTRLGRITELPEGGLKAALGDGDVTVSLSITRPQ